MKSELKTTIASDYSGGMSLSDLSKKYKIPKRTIHYNLTKLEIIRKKSPIKKISTRSNLLIGAFIGIWAGDGSKFYYNGYTIKIHLNKQNKNLIRFCQHILINLFGKKFRVNNDGGNRVSIRIFSKFVFDFIDKFCYYKVENKTYTIRLKRVQHKNSFLRGFLLGLILSDGYIKGNSCIFTSISKGLIKNAEFSFNNFGFKPRFYKFKNRNWKPVYRLKLTSKETIKFRLFLSKILKDLNWSFDIETVLAKSYD